MQSIRPRVSGSLLLLVALVAPSATAAPAGQLAFLNDPAEDRLVVAAKEQDWPAVAELLETGINVNRRLGDGATALHWAAYWDALKTARRLIDAGAGVDMPNDLGVTPLWLACNNGSASMVGLLLDAGADPEVALPSGETPLMTASRTGNTHVVTRLLEHGAAVNTAERSHGQTALMWAVAQRHPAVVGVLLRHGSNVSDRSKAYPKVVSSSGNADPSGVYEISQGGYTPLLFAARHGDLESARLLVEAGADVNDTAPIGTSALVVAAHSGHAALAKFLLEEGADPNAANAGYTALHAAVLRGDLDAATALMTHGANPNPKVTRGTPGRRASADWTLGHGMIGATPFWLAARFHEPDIMRVLAKNGADPQADLEGTTAVMAALQGGTARGRFQVARLDREEEGRLSVDAVKLALDSGANVNATTIRGDTALHIAASRRLDAMIELLVERGAVVDVRNDRGQTPLTLAIAGPQGLAALYNPGSGSEKTEAVLRALGATDEGAPPETAGVQQAGR